MAVIKKNVSRETAPPPPAKERKKREKQYKTNDFDVRAAVVRQLLLEGVPRGDIRHELTLDSHSSGGRADIVVLGRDDLRQKDFIGGIEIKSGKDVLDRCASQSASYSDAFDRKIFIMDKYHIPAAGEAGYRYHAHFYCHDTPGFFKMDTDIIYQKDENGKTLYSGQYLVDGVYKWVRHETTRVHFIDYKARVKNIGMFATEYNTLHACNNNVVGMSSLLWRNEIAEIAARLNVSCKKPSRAWLIDYFQEHMSLAQIRPLIMDQLRRRVHSEWEKNFWAKFDEMEKEKANEI